MKGPEIIIKLSDTNNAFRSLGGVLGVIVGIGLIIISNSGSEPTTSGIVFGGILIIGGLIKIISSTTARSTSKEEFAIKINGEKIHLDGIITDEEETMIIPLDEISNVTSNVSQGGTTSLTINLKGKNLIENGYIDLDIALASGDWLKIKDLINSLVDKNEIERNELLKNSEFNDK